MLSNNRKTRAFFALWLLLALVLVLFPGVPASAAETHVSRCEITNLSTPGKAGVQMVGGFGGFDCDNFGNHHEYVEIKMEVEFRVLNLPGKKFDVYETLVGVHSPARYYSSKVDGQGYPGITKCMKHTIIGTFKMKETLSIVGRHGVVQKIAHSEPRDLSCVR